MDIMTLVSGRHNLEKIDSQAIAVIEKDMAVKSRYF